MKDAGVPIDYVLEIDVPFDEIIQRLSGRRVHPPSGRSYHPLFNPPKVEGIDDISGEPLIQREDDKEETIRTRLQVYESQTKPLIAYYSNWAAHAGTSAQTAAVTPPQYRKISGLGNIDEIHTRVLNALA